MSGYSGLIPYGEDLANLEDKGERLKEKREKTSRKRLILPSKKRALLEKADKKIERNVYKTMSVREFVRASPTSDKSYQKIRAKRDLLKKTSDREKQKEIALKKEKSLKEKLKKFMDRNKSKDKNIGGR